MKYKIIIQYKNIMKFWNEKYIQRNNIDVKYNAEYYTKLFLISTWNNL